MTEVLGYVIKLDKIGGTNSHVIVTILVPKTLGFVGRPKDIQVRYEDLHFGRVKIIQEDYKHDV